MRRTKKWWAALTKDERSWLVYAERQEAKGGGGGYGGGGYLPDDVRECAVCGQPCMVGTCDYCLDMFLHIIGKADAACVEKQL